MGRRRTSEEIKGVILLLLKKEKRRNYFEESEKGKILKLYMLYKQVRNFEKKNKRIWVSETYSLENRMSKGASFDLIPMWRSDDPKAFYRFLRMSPVTFDLLLKFVGPKIAPARGVRQPIYEKERLEIVLHYLATGDLMVSNGLLFRISESATNNFISIVCDAIWETLHPVVFEQPSEDMWRRVAKDFDDIWNFPHCIGAIDGKLIPMEVILFAKAFMRLGI